MAGCEGQNLLGETQGGTSTREYRTWHKVLIEQLADRDEAIDYLQVTLEEYQVDQDIPFFLRDIRNVIEAKGGISELARKTGIVPQVLSDMFSTGEALHLDTFSSILRALGCRLSIEPLEVASQSVELAPEVASLVLLEGANPGLELTTKSDGVRSASPLDKII